MTIWICSSIQWFMSMDNVLGYLVHLIHVALYNLVIVLIDRARWATFPECLHFYTKQKRLVVNYF